IRQLPEQELAERTAPFLEEKLGRTVDRTLLQPVIPLIRERVKLLTETVEMADFFFREGELEYDTKALLGKKLADAPAVAATALQAVVERISDLDHWQHEALEGAIRPQAEELGLKTGELFGLIRVAVTGRTAAPPLFETMAVLGRERSLERLESALRRLQYRRPGRHRPKGGS
ncbi:MAG: glutamate--tRNA ligase, partial [Dehalococcoidia bacterium]